MLQSMQRSLYVKAGPANTFETAITLERPSISRRAAVRIVRKATLGPQPMPLVKRANATEEIDVCEVLEEIDLHPDNRGPLVSVSATQELSADDVLDVRNAPIVDDDVDAFVHRHEYPSVRPFAIDTGELQFDRERITLLSFEEVTRRKRRGGLFVGAAVGFGVAVMLLAGLTQAVPMSGSQRLESTTPLLARGHRNDLQWTHAHRTSHVNPKNDVKAPAVVDAPTFSIDALPVSPATKRH